MSKKIVGYVKLQVPAGKANPAPPIGPALGQRGLNIMEFCKAFNGATQAIEAGTPVPVVITVFENKTFTFVTKTPPVSFYLKQYAKVAKGSSATKKDPIVGCVSTAQCLEIAKIKLVDLNTDNLDAAVKIVKGTAESMGIDVVEEGSV